MGKFQDRLEAEVRQHWPQFEEKLRRLEFLYETDHQLGAFRQEALRDILKGPQDIYSRLSSRMIFLETQPDESAVHRTVNAISVQDLDPGHVWVGRVHKPFCLSEDDIIPREWLSSWTRSVSEETFRKLASDRATVLAVLDEQIRQTESLLDATRQRTKDQLVTAAVLYKSLVDGLETRDSKTLGKILQDAQWRILSQSSIDIQSMILTTPVPSHATVMEALLDIPSPVAGKSLFTLAAGLIPANPQGAAAIGKQVREKAQPSLLPALDQEIRQWVWTVTPPGNCGVDGCKNGQCTAYYCYENGRRIRDYDLAVPEADTGPAADLYRQACNGDLDFRSSLSADLQIRESLAEWVLAARLSVHKPLVRAARAWDRLSTEERQDILKDILDIQADVYGFPVLQMSFVCWPATDGFVRRGSFRGGTAGSHI
ncbi:MAG: hypothetical protein M3O22_07475, partial [Pseudomonadota bacterium]|nr:hypothetical protein [Pseudomonadota bacterium]